MASEVLPSARMRFGSAAQEALRCPVCRSALYAQDDSLICGSAACGAAFPVVAGIPILIDDAASVFSIDDYRDHSGAALRVKSRTARLLVDLVPGISLNVKGKANYRTFTERLLARGGKPRVLIIGGGVIGEGMEVLLDAPGVELVETDVAFGQRVSIICDAHSIPFAAGSFDGVIVQAVLEHVVDPVKVVAEIHRVLKPSGLVYAETPFLQHVHLGRYDFTRFTDLGHRRLFRDFSVLSSGPVCGPGMALSWAYQGFLLSFVRRSLARRLIKTFARLTSFWLKYFDYLLVNTPGGNDSASGFFFLGERSDETLSDRELLKLYRGAQATSSFKLAQEMLALRTAQ